MANKFPLILNTSANQIQEIASGDNLDLTGCGINNAGVITATSFSGNITGSVTGNADTATLATNVTVTANNSTNETVYPLFVDGATGTQGAESDTGLTYNPSSGNLTSTQFTGTLQTAAQTNITSVGTLSSLDVSGNVSIGGTLTYEDVTNIDSVGLITARNGITVSSGTATFQGAIDANSDLDVDGHTNLDNVSIAGVTTFQNDLNLGDNDILRIGNSSDLQLYHDGNSHVSDRGGAGSLWVESNNQVVIKQNDVNHYMAIFNQGGASELRYNNSTKISTTNTGSIITGICTATDFSGAAGGAADFPNGLTATTGAFSGDATFNGGSAAITISANSSIRLNNGSWTGDYTKITHHDNKLFVQGGNDGIRFRNISGSRQLKMDNDGHFGPDNGQTYNLGSTSHRWANINGVAGNFTGNIVSTAAFKTSPSGTDGDGVIIENSASLKLRVDSAKTVSFDARSNSGSACIVHKWNSPNAAGGNYEPYEEAWYDGNSYHKIKSNNNQFEFDSPLKTVGNSANFTTEESGGASVEIRSGGAEGYIGTRTNHPIRFVTYSSTAGNGGRRWEINANGDFIPIANNTYDIGSSSTRVKNIYTNDLNLSNEGSTNDVDGTWGNYTIQEGEDDLFLINRRSGKRYKFNLTEVD